MLIVCPNCATSYQVAPSSLGATGRSVRCVRCRKVWFAANTAVMADIALSHHQDIAALSGTDATSRAAFDAPPAETLLPVDGAPPVQAGDPADAPAAWDERADEPKDEPSDDLIRDDRGPAPRPEPRDLDAVPIAIDDAPALVPGSPGGPSQAVPDPIRDDIESVAARRTKRQRARRTHWPVAGWAAVTALLVAINIALIAWRADVVRMLPQTARVYAAIGLDVNLRGLVFTEVTTRDETQDGAAMLVVEGVIKNTSKRDTDVPRLRFAVHNAQGQEIYNWTALPDQTVIAPGASLPFRSRLASPPPEAHAVLVRFFHRRDLVAGLQ